MIYDTLNNLPNYLGVSDNLDTVIEYIMARDITTLPAAAHAHTVDDFIFFKIDIQVAQTEVEIKI